MNGYSYFVFYCLNIFLLTERLTNPDSLKFDWWIQLRRRLMRFLFTPSRQVLSYIYSHVAKAGCAQLSRNNEESAVFGFHARSTNYPWSQRPWFGKIAIPASKYDSIFRATSALFLASDAVGERELILGNMKQRWPTYANKNAMFYFDSMPIHSNVHLHPGWNNDSFVAVVADITFLSFHTKYLYLTRDSSFSIVIAMLTPLAHEMLSWTPVTSP